MIMSNHLPSFSVISTISSIFTDTGSWCVELLETALAIFQSLCNSGMDILQKKVGNSMFSDFWTIINTVADVFSRIAGPLVVLFFIYKLFDEVTDARSQLDIWSISRTFIKVGIASALVSNAVKIVKYIFKIGSLLAKLVYTLAGNTEADFDTALTLPDEYVNALETGVNGLKGYIILIVYLIGALAVIVCGVLIAMAVYQRIFKMFVIMPFASFSFATYILPDGKGHEIFQGYLKNILKTSFEAVIIMLIISFSFIMIRKGTTTEQLFPASLASVSTIEEEVSITNDDEMIYFYRKTSSGIISSTNMLISGIVIDSDNVSSDVKSIAKTVSKSNGYILIDGEEISESLLYEYYNAAIVHTQEYPVTITAYGEASWSDCLIILLRILFPALLAAAAVKEVDKYTGIIVGGFS